MHLQNPNCSPGFDGNMQTTPAPAVNIRPVEDCLSTDTVCSGKNDVPESQSFHNDLDSPALRLMRYRKQAYHDALLDVASECTGTAAVQDGDTEETVFKHAASHQFNVDSQVRSSLLFALFTMVTLALPYLFMYLCVHVYFIGKLDSR